MTHRRLIGALLALGIITTGILAWTLGAEGAAPMNRASTTCAKDGYDASAFRRQVDSIVAYGKPVSAHDHGFYGRVDISSTMNAHLPTNPAHLDDPGYVAPAFSNCKIYGDWAAYWFPYPKLNGALITPGALRTTWQAPAGTKVAVPPFGETFVSGNAMATTTPSHVRFTCGDIDGAGSPIPTACATGLVTAEVTFPDCWDGTTAFDTPTGISPAHFSYSPCAPGSTPMAQLVTQQTFIDPRTNQPMTNPLNADGTLALSFASGPYYTYHADYLNTWNHMLRDIVSYCLNTGGPAGAGCPAGTYINLINPAHQLD